MVLGFFGRSEGSVEEHITRKRYTQAIELLRAELQKRRHDRRLRLKLGDVLVLAGRKREAVEVLASVADDMALAGQAAQAIAVLKKVQAIDPGHADVEEKLAYMIDQQSRPADSPWAGSTRGVILPESPKEELGFDEIGLAGGEGRKADSPPAADEGKATADTAAPPNPVAAPPTFWEAPARPARPADLGLDASAAADTEPRGNSALDDTALSDEVVRNELVSMIEETLGPAPPASGPPEARKGAAASPSVVVGETPLFRSFARAELVALIRGLRLLRFEAGQIVVTEGEAGGSLFVVTSGSLRAFVKSPGGKNVEVRQLQEGEFFGEISVLTGNPRSATVTAAERSELLELDRATLESISEGHPHVREVLQQFHDQRSANSLETLVREMGARPS